MIRTRYVITWCCGIIAAFFLPALGSAWTWAACWLLCGLSIAAAWFIRSKKWFQAALCALCLLSGTAYGVWRTQQALSQQWTVQMYPKSVPLTIEVTGLPNENETLGRSQFIANAHDLSGNTFRLSLHDYQARDWALGSRWQVQARVRAPVAQRNLVGFDGEAWALAQGIDGTASLAAQRFRLPDNTWDSPVIMLNRARQSVRDKWQRTAVHAPEGAALMRALTVGDKAGLNDTMWAAFRPLGLNHLISISGLHITLFAALMAAALKLAFRFLPHTPQSPHRWTVAGGWLAAAIYTALSGGEVPALRSLLMLSVFALYWWRGALVNAWHTWWLAMAAVLLYQPMAVLAVGFWLSFGLVGALLWVLSNRVHTTWHITWRTRLAQSIAGQWAATLIGGVAVIFLFGMLPLFSPLVNAVAIPWFSWLLVPLGLLASVLPFDTPALWVAHLAQHTMNCLLWLGSRLPEIAFARAPTPWFIAALCAGLILLLPRGGRTKPLAVIALMGFLLYRPTPLSGSLKAEVLDVGQGLAVLLQTPQYTLLYDTGTPAAELALLPNLRARGIFSLDTLILSHHDNDHDGGYPALSAAMPIGQIFAGQPEFYSAAKDCRNIESWQQDNVLFELLTLPRSDRHTENDNAQSCVLRVLVGDTALLITGDLDQQGEHALLAHYSGSLKSDVLVLGHHGSRSSSSSAFINTVSPRWAIASSGFANSFKHPHPDVQNRLAAHQVKLLRTDTQGAIAFMMSPRHIELLPPIKKYWWQKKPFDTN